MIKLDVPLIKQSTETDCSLTCGLMLLRYYKYRVSRKDLFSKFKKDKLNIFELASILEPHLKRRKIKINFFNYNFFRDEIDLAHRLKKTKTSHLKILNDIKKALSTKKIIIKHKIFFTEDIENIIKKGNPLITLVSVMEFRNVNLKRWRGHFIVLTGFDNKRFYYNDPHRDKNKFGRHGIEKGRLFAAIFRTQFPAILWIE